MKSFFQNRLVIGIGAFFLGALSLWGTQRALSHFQIQTRFESVQQPLQPEDLMQAQDPFERMRKMQEQMWKQMNEEAIGESGGAFQATEISSDFKTREDDKYVYYDIQMKGLNPQKLDVKVENGQVNITGEFAKKNESSGAESFVTSTFQRTFPAPENVDADKFQLENKEGLITLKFPKRS